MILSFGAYGSSVMFLRSLGVCSSFCGSWLAKFVVVLVLYLLSFGFHRYLICYQVVSYLVRVGESGLDEELVVA